MNDSIGMQQTLMGFMDDDHDQAAERFDGLLALADCGSTRLTAAFRDFIEHNRAHFAREEALMSRVAFPPATRHKAEHETALAEWETYIGRLETGVLDAAGMATVLRNKLLPGYGRHVQTMDRLTGSFVRNLGPMATDTAE